MKKIIFHSILVLSLTSLVLFTGCKDPNPIPPTIIFDQPQDTTILLYTVFEDPGVIVEDNSDNSEDIEVTSDFDDVMLRLSTGEVRRTGDYEITYTATDTEGNHAEDIRTVQVVNPAEIITGSYEVQGTYDNIDNTTFVANITADAGQAGNVHFSKTYVHDVDGNSVYLNLTGLLYSPDHSPDITDPAIAPDDNIGWLGTSDDPGTPFYAGMYHYETMPLMPRYNYIHIPSYEVTEEASDINYIITGKKDTDTDLPLSRIHYSGDNITQIELHYNISDQDNPAQGADNVDEIYTPH
ncbi:MAG: immunoglobulin-like domain-containing protein [Bacteroidales bacterium]